MSKRKLLLWIVGALLAIAAFICWIEFKVDEGLKTMHLAYTKGSFVRAFSGLVLAPSLAEETAPVVHPDSNDSVQLQRRYALVETWLNASHLFIGIRDSLQPKETPLSSSSVEKVPPSQKTDGWGNPFCIYASSKRITFVSSSGNGIPDCEKLRQSVERGTVKAKDFLLFREGDVLMIVYPRAGSVEAAPNQME